MPSPKTLLPWLIGGAIGAGGIFQGLHWKSTTASGDVSGLEEQLRIAGEENELLKRENESLRSLAQGGGEMAVPQEVVDRIEKEFGLRFKSTPVVHRVGSDELRDRISASIESKFGPAGIDYRQEAYAYIGWLLPDDKLLAQLAAVRAVGARSWFDDSTGEGWVTDRFQIENIPDQAALVRVVAKILLHQNFPPDAEYPGDDRARAREALFQGAAAGSEARFYAANARSIGFMPMAANAEAEQLMNSLSPFIQGLTLFPAVEGKNFADGLHVAGNDKLAQALREPPETTREILRPSQERKAVPGIALPELGQKPFMSESAGELGLRLWLEPLGDVEAAVEISSAWVADRYELFPDGESSAVIWDIILESKEMADRLQEISIELISAMAGKEETVPFATPVETLESRFLMISRPAPDRVRFLHTAKKETSEKLR